MSKVSRQLQHISYETLEFFVDHVNAQRPELLAIKELKAIWKIEFEKKFASERRRELAIPSLFRLDVPSDLTVSVE